MQLQNRKQIVISSGKPPRAIQFLEDRLKSRFECGMFADISMPESETKLGIMKNHEKNLNFDIDETILSKIVKYDNLNIRELEGIVNQLFAQSTLNNGIITTEIIEKIIKFYNK